MAYEWQHALLAIQPIGADLIRERSPSRVSQSACGPRCFGREPEAARLRAVPAQGLAARWPPLTVILLGSRLERREDGRPARVRARRALRRPAGDGRCPGSRPGGSPPCAAGCKGGAASPVTADSRGRIAPARRVPPPVRAQSRRASSRGVTGRTARGALRAPLKSRTESSHRSRHGHGTGRGTGRGTGPCPTPTGSLDAAQSALSLPCHVARLRLIVDNHQVDQSSLPCPVSDEADWNSSLAAPGHYQLALAGRGPARPAMIVPTWFPVRAPSVRKTVGTAGFEPATP